MTAHRVGIMGGTFDPVHYGHLIVANEVAQLLDLESVIFSPAARPWHKAADHLAPPEDRLEMLSLALEAAPDFVVSTVDLDRGGDTYTIDTLEDLDAQFEAMYPGESVDWFFITGADALASLHGWKAPTELLQRATFVGVSRTGHELELPAIAGADRIILVEIDEIDISSSGIRDRLALGETIDGLVPDVVADYIREHGLYQGPRA
jgi:nicotinate-nucleotide adenylyltransferase